MALRLMMLGTDLLAIFWIFYSKILLDLYISVFLCSSNMYFFYLFNPTLE